MKHLIGFVIATLLWVLAATILLDWWLRVWLPSKRLPPGPNPWPLVGSLLQLRRNGSNPLTVSQKLESKYGRMVTFWIGKKPLIVINDPELAHEGLVKQGAMFANRCQLSSIAGITRGFNSVASSHGAAMTTMRKNMITNMLSTKALKARKAERDTNLKEVITQIGQAVADSDDYQEVQVSKLVRHAFFVHALFSCFGMDLGTLVIEQIDEIVHRRVTNSFSLYIGDYIPLWRLFETKNRRLLLRNQEQLEAVILPIVQRTRELKRSGNVVVGTYVETLLNLQETEGKEFLDDEAIVCYCIELIIGSTHTTAAAIHAAIAVLSDRPDIQTALFDEIQSVVGDMEPVDDSHLSELPYLSAFGTEVLRVHPPLVAAIPHATVRSCRLGGYDIPSNAVLYFHIQAYQMDPESWNDPQEFRPERFFKTDVDFTGTRSAKLIPFGAGRRICPAITVGLTEMSLMIARMVQSFEWKSERLLSEDGSGHSRSASQDGCYDARKRKLYAKGRGSNCH